MADPSPLAPLYRLYERRFLRQVQVGAQPRHVGPILDGNRCYGQRRRLTSPHEIHAAGVQKLDELLAWCAEFGIPAITHGEALSGVVLAGSNGKPAPLTVAVRIIARSERLRLGPRGRSALVHSLAFGSFNEQFEPIRTEADWLSRDLGEVDKYVADPLCRFRPALQLWVDLLDALSEIAKPARQARIPKQLSIYVIAGTRDPVSANSKGLEQLLSAYHTAGLQHVTYPLLSRGPPRALQRDQPGRGDVRVACLAA